MEKSSVKASLYICLMIKNPLIPQALLPNFQTKLLADDVTVLAPFVIVSQLS